MLHFFIPGEYSFICSSPLIISFSLKFKENNIQKSSWLSHKTFPKRISYAFRGTTSHSRSLEAAFTNSEYAGSSSDGTVPLLYWKCSLWVSVHIIHHLVLFAFGKHSFSLVHSYCILPPPKAGISSFPSFLVILLHSSPHYPLVNTIKHLL